MAFLLRRCSHPRRESRYSPLPYRSYHSCNTALLFLFLFFLCLSLPVRRSRSRPEPLFLHRYGSSSTRATGKCTAMTYPPFLHGTNPPATGGRVVFSGPFTDVLGTVRCYAQHDWLWDPRERFGSYCSQDGRRGRSPFATFDPIRAPLPLPSSPPPSEH